MTEWIECKLSDLGEVVGGATPSTKDCSNYDGNIAWLTPKDLSSFSGRYIEKGERSISEKGFKSCSTKMLPINSILFSSRAPIGYVAIAAKELCTNQGFKSVIPNSKVDYMFLYYLLKYKKKEIEGLGSGTTFKEVSGNVMKNAMVYIPKDKVVQKKIAGILDKIDCKIENNNNINRNLYEQAVALFEAMYQEYPIKKISELDIFVTDYVANGSFASLKENVTILEEKNYAYFIRNVDLKAKEFPRFVNQHSYEFLSKSKLVGGEVIISNVGDVGSVFLCPKLDGPMTLGNNMIMLTSPKHNNYLYLLFKSYIGQGKIGGITGGSAQSKFNKTDFKSLEINYPDESQVDEFNEKTSALLDMISKLDEENKRLTALKNSLLPKLMCGELDLSDLDI